MSVVYKNKLQYESNWIPVALDSGFTSATGVYYKIVGNMCFWKGTVTRTAGAFPTSTTTFITGVPSETTPISYARYPVNTGASGTAAGAWADISGGNMRGWSNGSAVASDIYLAGMAYRIA